MARAMRAAPSPPLLLLLLALALCLHCLTAIPHMELFRPPLPFPIKTHPLALSSDLFAASALTSASNRTFSSSTAASAQQLKQEDVVTSMRLGDVPFPTGAWWTNLVLGEGTASVVSLPYIFRVLGGKLHVSYPFRVVRPTTIESGFLSQIVLSCLDSTGHARPLQQQVVDFDSFGVTLRFAHSSPAAAHANSTATATATADVDTDGYADAFLAHLVRGSPYVTLEFQQATPVIESMDGLRITRIKKYTDSMDKQGRRVGFTVYGLQLSNNQMWYAFASGDSLNLRLHGATGRVVATSRFTGVLRLALALTGDALAHLLDSAPVYPTGGDVSFTVDPETDADAATMTFAWKTRRFPALDASVRQRWNATSEPQNKQVLMLALPHHLETLVAETKQIETMRYTSIRGVMVGVVGDAWVMNETLPSVDWDYGATGLFAKEEKNEEDAQQEQDRDESRRRREELAKTARTLIVDSLQTEVDTYPMLSPDSYNFGKQISREARLLVMAHRFQQKDVMQRLVTKMTAEMGAWLEGTNPDHLVYDQRFGGVLTNDGIRDQGADYGLGYYNDHHFHYGYFVYTLAVLRRFAPEFVASHAAATAMLMGDIGTPLASMETRFFHDLPARALFPTARHKDWFVGHSYASGLFSMEGGKSQESSSECLNAYYALSLFSSLDEQHADAHSYYQYARLLLATELRSTKAYWHMHLNSQIYEPVFAKNTMVGVVGDMSVVYSTWFGSRPIYVHGINLMPFTPLTTQLLSNQQYVKREFALIQGEYDTLSTGDIWRSIVVLDHAVVDAATAWHELTTSITAFDVWNSRANSLLWVATRPSWSFDVDPASSSAGSAPAAASAVEDEDGQCFGYPECNIAGANGTALMCCDSLPGCCPSALGCCPPVEPENVPLNACFGEHQCGLLGLGCCNSIEGCCAPDPVTGDALGCCRDPHPGLPATTASSSSSEEDNNDDDDGVEEGDGFCLKAPLCAAAKLQCCGLAEGCCQPDPVSGGRLDCCPPPALVSASMSSSTCHNEPQCAAAGLDCCATDAGCCVPDPVSGAKLLCCQQEEPSESDSSTPAPKEATSTTTGNGNGSDADASSGGGFSSLLVSLLTIVVGVMLIVLGVNIYRRRQYQPLDRDMRTWVCGAFMIVIFVLFFYLAIIA